MSLQYIEPTGSVFPVGIFAKTGTGGNQQGAGKPSAKKKAKKAAKKKKK